MSYRKRIFLSFVVATLVLFSVAAAVYISFAQMNRQKHLVEHTYDVITTVQDIMSDLKDIQSSVRGYVITEQEDYLTPYFISVPRVNQGLTTLSGLISDNPHQIQRTQTLSARISQRIQIADNVLTTYRLKGQASAFSLIKQGSGKREMDEIRAIVADMINEEKDLLDARKQAVDTSARLTVSAGIIGLMVCFCILVVVFWLISRENQNREKTEHSLKESIGNVETINRETQMISRMGDYLRTCRNAVEANDMIRRTMPLLLPETYGAVYVFNNSRNLLQKSVEWGNRADMVKDFEPEDCWALRQGRPHESVSDSNMPVCTHIDNLHEDGAVCLPMQAHGETFGLIFIAAQPDAIFDERRRITIRTVAEQISLALANLKLQNALKEQSIKDPLTKLFNRRYLEETLAREQSRTKRNNQTLAVLMMDIDFFKKVNDTYGHDGGDAVLVGFARLLLNKSRKEDIACRLGGEEFVLVLPTASLELARDRAQEICEETRRMQIKHGQQMIAVTVSIGIAVIPMHGETAEEALQNADAALYIAKKTGRDQVVVYNAA